MTNRIVTLGMVNKLVDRILGSIVFAKREVAPVNGFVSDLSECSNECCYVGECGLTSVDLSNCQKGMR